ncbi:TPA: hypothetical protein ACPJ1C_002329 [Vibrio diabolicus]|uniref:hypothetical protein n=1 Tax=Vibrio diabolicus TaxID=50719 RepID=UPI0037539266
MRYLPNCIKKVFSKKFLSRAFGACLIVHYPAFSFQLTSVDDGYLLTDNKFESDYMVYTPGAKEAEITNAYDFACVGSKIEVVKIRSEINNAVTHGEQLQYYFFLVTENKAYWPLRIVESFQTVDKDSQELVSEHLPFTKHDDLGLACDLIRPQVKSYYFSQAFEAIPKHTHSKGD